MNLLLEVLERIGIGRPIDPSDYELLSFRDGHTLTLRDFTEAISVIASSGKGKTTLSRTFLRALLREGFGGLVLTVKESQIALVQELCALEGRETDCLVFDSPHVFNPLEDETDIGEAAALLAELSEIQEGKVKEGGADQRFWRNQLSIILKNLFCLNRIATGSFDIVTAASLFGGRASTLTELSDPMWQRNSPLFPVLQKAKSLNDPHAALAVEYFTRDFPLHGDRLQGSLAATVASVFDQLRRPPLSQLFTGTSTVNVRDLLERGKICVVGLPVLSGINGVMANAIWQFCFCRAATRSLREIYSFFFSDECQETVSRELMGKFALLREFKVASIIMTQNLAVLDEKIGTTAREGLLGLTNTKIFGTQGHAATRQWAADQIGKRKVPQQTTSKGNTSGKSSSSSNRGTSVQMIWDYQVPPITFAELPVGKTICLRDGKVWPARWHKDQPGRNGTVRIVVS